MPSPTLAELWRGHSPTTDLPGGCHLLRVINVGAAAWAEIDLRTADYAGAADGLAQDSAGVARGILRAVMILNNSGTAGEHVNISLNVSGGAPVPANAYNVALVEGPSLDIRIPVIGRPAITSFWLRAEAGTPDCQVEIWYDVPPAP